MVIDFNNIAEQHIDGFKGGQGIMHSRAFADGRNRIMLNRLEPGASGGRHTHAENCEMIYVVEGELTFTTDGARELCQAGQLHYCAKGLSHTFVNTSDRPTTFVAIMAEQR